MAAADPYDVGVDVFVGAFYVIMAGSVVAAAYYGSPEVARQKHSREQDERQREIDALEQRVHEAQFTAGFRSAPKDVSRTVSRIEGLKNDQRSAWQQYVQRWESDDKDG